MNIGNFTKRQWLTLITFGIADFCNAICVSLQAPFYPREAELKGSTATEYGLVFGIFELVVFLISPIYGQHLNRIGPKYLFNGGIFTTGTCAILFGLLDKVEGHVPFITMSFLIRIIEALGNAAFLTASFAMIAKEFPENVSMTFACLETFFGLGLIVGPTVGGALYQVGGYSTPFAVLGSVLFLSAIMTAFVLPSHPDRTEDTRDGVNIFQVLKIPGVALAAASIIVTSLSIGFLQATLEPHLRKFELTPVILGLMFVVNGAVYAMTAPVWGWLCDRRARPKVVTICGCVLIMIAFCMIGPAPFFPGDTLLGVTITGLVFHGLGIAAQLVASFTDALRTAIENGFPNDIETYGLISGLWTSTFALGAFIGPSTAGILYDSIGFRNATMFVVGLQGLVAVGVTTYLCCTRKRPGFKEVQANGTIADTETKYLLSDASHPPYNGSIANGSTSSAIENRRDLSNTLACHSYTSSWRSKDCIGNRPFTASYGSLETRRGFLESIA